MLKAGSTIGILGGGQLGQMLAKAGRKLGYKFHVYSDEAGSPACLVADEATVGEYNDLSRLENFAKNCQLVTYEFENIPFESADLVSRLTEVRPSIKALKTFQNRSTEKSFLRDHGIKCADFSIVEDVSELRAAVQKIGMPAVLKTAGFGYDGKGQTKILNNKDLENALNNLKPDRYVLEAFVDFDCEVSMVCARSRDGEVKNYGLVLNEHRDHILHISSVPGSFSPELEAEAGRIASIIAKEVDYTGVFCVEFFLTKNKKLLVNEIAPRVHNSGHLTIEACQCSQFEQHIRAITGMALGDPTFQRPTAMLNLLGQLWKMGEPDWESLQKSYRFNLHLYAKKTAKHGRKMGHLTLSGGSTSEVVAQAEEIFEVLVAKAA